MKLSVKWLQEFTKIDLPVDELVTKIGAQLGEVEQVEHIGEKYRGAVVVAVRTCGSHPNADRLHVCTIDDGGNTPDVKRNADNTITVVCGAPNVRQGMVAVWLPPGITVPDSYGKEPFVLSSRDIRGVMSHGMLASPKELALFDSHDGILEIDAAAKPGTDFAEAYGLDDCIIDIENKMFTHRPDLFGELGLAREIAGITDQTFQSPEWYLRPDVVAEGLPKAKQLLPLQLKNELPELVPRFMAAVLNNVEIKDSPQWLKSYLARMGLRPINNVVDVTNYMMLLTGQPLHAYDYDKVAAQSGSVATLCIRNPRGKENVQLLSGKTITPRADAIMIATDRQLIGIGGVMGGAATEVDDSTTTIILECANFDMYSVRRTSMAHGLFTDAVTRFTKGQSPLQNPAVLYRSLQLLHELSGGQLASDVLDDTQVSGRSWVHPPVPVTSDFINERLGLELTAKDMQQLLENVECTVELDDNDTMTVCAPFWRTDIETREDVVEEIGRLHGYDRLPLKVPTRSISPAPQNELLVLKQRIRRILARAGANEVLSYSFVHGDLLQKAGQDKTAAFQLANALSPELQYYRLSITPSLLEKVHPNIKAGYDQFALFEIGKAHNLSHAASVDGLPLEFEMLDVVYAASDKAAGLGTEGSNGELTSAAGAAYYQAQKLLTYLLNELGVNAELRPFAGEEVYEVAKPYDHSRSAKVFAGDNVPLGMVGEYKGSVRRALKLPQQTAGFGIELSQLLPLVGRAARYTPLPKFPSVVQDVTVNVPMAVPYAAAYKLVNDQVTSLAPANSLIQLSPISIYRETSSATTKHMTWRLCIASYEKTLTDKEVQAVLNTAKTAAETHLKS